MKLQTIFILLAALIIAAFFLKQFAKRTSENYKEKQLMSGNELEFFHRIRRAALDGHVFPQVAMSALIEPATSRGKAYQAAFRRISQKRVDYVVFDADMKLLAVIELDDKTHDSRKDAIRDAYLDTAGITTIRYQSKNKPTEAKIQADLVAILLQNKS